MKRILIPTQGPSDWRKLLRDPDVQWRRRKSAFEVAVSWELAQAKGGCGLPKPIADALNSDPDLRGADLFFAVPEHRVKLDTGRAPSQNDVWALLRHSKGFISLAIEGKAGEPFDKTVSEWRKGTKEGDTRLRWICEKWLKSDPAPERCGPLRYQLFHRTASALIEASNFRAFAAVMLVQSFHDDPIAKQDFGHFLNYLGATANGERLVAIPGHDNPRLFLGWVDCECATDDQIVATIANNQNQ